MSSPLLIRIPSFQTRITMQASSTTTPRTPTPTQLQVSKNLYQVLRLHRAASPAEIKASYRSLVKEFHPDANKLNSPRDFIQIHDAYATLSDPIARARYDLSRSLSLNMRGSVGFASDDFIGFRGTTTRWETDQCW